MSKEIVVAVFYLYFVAQNKQYKSIGFFPINHAYSSTVKLYVFFSLFPFLLSINLDICLLFPFVLLSLKALNDFEKRSFIGRTAWVGVS